MHCFILLLNESINKACCPPEVNLFSKWCLISPAACVDTTCDIDDKCDKDDKCETAASACIDVECC